MSLISFNQSANLTTYSIGLVYVNSAVLQEHNHVVLSQRANSRVINTISGSYAGDAAGPAISDVVVTSNIPYNGFDFDPSPFMQELAQLSFVIDMGNSTNQFQGQIYEASYEHGVESSAKLIFKARGKMNVWNSS